MKSSNSAAEFQTFWMPNRTLSSSKSTSRKSVMTAMSIPNEIEADHKPTRRRMIQYHVEGMMEITSGRIVSTMGTIRMRAPMGRKVTQIIT
jgi:hypothetical protein